MSKSLFNPTRAATSSPASSAEKAAQVFLDYLDDKLPPLLAAEALSTVLRTEAPVYFGMPRIVDLVRSWAGRRATDSSRPVVEYLINAVWRIGHANASGVLEGFAPARFFPEFISKLQALCPAEQQPAFHSRIREIRDYFEWDFGDRPELIEHRVLNMEGIAIAGSLESDFNDLADQLLETHNADGPFNKILTQLREQLYQTDIHPDQCLERLIEHGITLFNLSKYQHAERVFNLVREGFKLPQLGDEVRQELRAQHHSNELNHEVLIKLLGDATKHNCLKAALPVFADLDAKNLFKRLRFEKDKEYRRVLLTLLKLHGPDIFPLVIEELQTSQKEARSWYYMRNLIFLLSKVPPPSDFHRYVAVNLTGEFLRSKYHQLRSAALTTLTVLGGESAIDFMLDALNADHYNSVDLQSEQLQKYFSNLLAFLSRYPNDQTLTALAGVMSGAKLNFLPNGEPLRHSAYSLLKHHAPHLPTMTGRYLTSHLETELRSRGIGLGGFAVGIDTEYCLKILELLAHTRLPETQQLLQEIRGKYARHALGRRAADILSAQGKN